MKKLGVCFILTQLHWIGHSRKHAPIHHNKYFFKFFREELCITYITNYIFNNKVHDPEKKYWACNNVSLNEREARCNGSLYVYKTGNTSAAGVEKL